MTTDQRLEILESRHASLRAEHDALFIAYCALLTGELSQARLAKTMESLIANALSTSAPDAAADGYQNAGARLRAALIAAEIP